MRVCTAMPTLVWATHKICLHFPLSDRDSYSLYALSEDEVYDFICVLYLHLVQAVFTFAASRDEIQVWLVLRSDF
jgi:hypothetical protein